MLTAGPRPKTDRDRRVKFIISPAILLVAIALKFGQTTSQLVRER
jgi:hypothetical protein